jgi:hypothetical protein
MSNPMGTPATNYDTPLGTRLKDYLLWRSRLPENLQNTGDYDLQGAYLANAQQAANGHLGDQWKKPNHVTFSDQSQYSTPQMKGGTWAEDGRNAGVFWASPQNLANSGAVGLMNYFKKNEPDWPVILPINYNMPGRAK